MTTLPLVALVALVAVVLLAGAVQSSLGFGLGIVALPVVAIVAPESLPQSLILMILPSSALVMLQERRGIRWGSVGWILLGRTAGTVPGLLLLVLLSPRSLQLFFSTASLGAVAVMAWARRGWVLSRRSQVAGGVISGLLGTATSLGGIPLALLYANQGSQEIRSVLATSLFLGNLVSLLGLLLAGRLSLGDVQLAVGLMTPMFVGMYLGSRMVRGIGQRGLTLLVYSVVTFGSLIGIQRSIFG